MKTEIINNQIYTPVQDMVQNKQQEESLSAELVLDDTEYVEYLEQQWIQEQEMKYWSTE